MISFQNNYKLDKQATIILLTKEQVDKKIVPGAPKSFTEKAGALLNASAFAGKKGQMFPVTENKKIVLFVGLGPREDITLTALRQAVRQALLNGVLAEQRDLAVIPPDRETVTVKAVIEGLLIGGYVWDKYKTKDKKNPAPGSKKFLIAAPRDKIYLDTIKICEGVNLARNLVNDNADTITASGMEKVVRQLVKGRRNVRVTVLNKKELKAKGLNLHLAVNQGSRHEPKLIIVQYKGTSKKEYDCALIGKGITFDTGGLNLKPTGYIETMREDMGGSAAVVGTLKNVLSLGLKKNILFVCGMAENATGSGSYKPGDVFKSYSGKFVEIANTDAEGRLVLADAIAYITKNYKPRKIIDLATLTGACVVALGNDYSGLMSTDDTLANQLLDSAQATDDRAWRLPLYPEVKAAVKSQIADIKNIGFPKGAAGSITAAEFLRQFTDGKTPWAHLDIAGTAFVDSASRLYFGHGATGSGVRLLTHFLQTNK